MVIKVMKWPLWPLFSKKFQVSLTLNRLEGLSSSVVQKPGSRELVDDDTKFHVDVKWKGPKGSLGSRFRSMKWGKTSAASAGSSGTVSWEQEFENICVFTTGKTGAFQPWHVYLVLCKALPDGVKAKLTVAGTAVLDVGCLASSIGGSEKQSLSLPIRCNLGGSEDLEATFWVTLSFMELCTMHHAGSESVHRFMVPAMACVRGDPWTCDAEDCEERIAHVVAGKKEKTSKELSREHVLGWRWRKNPHVEDGSDATDDGKFSSRSDESLLDALDLFDSDFADDFDVEDYEDELEEAAHCEKSLSYGTLVGVNLVVEGALPHHRDDAEDVKNETDENLTIHSRSMVTSFPKVATSLEDMSPSGESGELVSQGSLLSILSWRKRKLSFRSTRPCGEPLLNKAYGEEGGDEIDWVRRQSSPTYQPDVMRHKMDDTSLAFLDFGEELFSVGSWERKDFMSRDGQTKLSAQVFFASLDQRSGSAAGESACTALVAVIADWLHNHPLLMPSKAEFDMLIHEGSAEWRNMCNVEAYKTRFPDWHFDLDTVIEAAVRPLSVVSEKSFIGFFQPEGVTDSCYFLQDTMSFDSIWEEVEQAGPAIYIVSWNDHFFVLKVEDEGCYIIDTLGERLCEGGSQAYILQFDADSSLCRSPRIVETSPPD